MMRSLKLQSVMVAVQLLSPFALATATAAATTVAPLGGLSSNQRRTEVSHVIWDRILKQYVDDQGRVAYVRLAAQGRGELDHYLALLAKADPAQMTTPDRLAFWINAYNAGIVAAILRGYSPESALSRIKLFRWYKFTVVGKDRTPAEIEHKILRKRFHDPRIHFALVCATTSCPKLRREAYRGNRLEQQLDDQARRFINDPSRNHIDMATGVVELSRIFEWFAADFTAQSGSVTDFVARYVNSPSEAALVRRQRSRLHFLEYNWTLNADTESRKLGFPYLPAPRRPADVGGPLQQRHTWLRSGKDMMHRLGEVR